MYIGKKFQYKTLWELCLVELNTGFVKGTLLKGDYKG